jgi:hypothetical protein
MRAHEISIIVMPGLEPGIHVFCGNKKKDVDGRDKPGHDEELTCKIPGIRVDRNTFQA